MDIENIKDLVKIMKNADYRELFAAIVLNEKIDNLQDLIELSESDLKYIDKIYHEFINNDNMNLLSDDLMTMIEEAEAERQEEKNQKRFDFECFMILKPSATLETFAQIEKYMKDLLKNDMIRYEILGLKNLAYEIKKHKKGYYLIFEYMATNSKNTEIEDYCRNQVDILKFMTVKSEEEE